MMQETEKLLDGIRKASFKSLAWVAQREKTVTHTEMLIGRGLCLWEHEEGPF